MSAPRKDFLPWGLIIVVTGLCVLYVDHNVALVRCPACQGAYQERIRHSRRPGITPFDAAAIRAWADEDLCRLCDNSGRVPCSTSRTYHGERPW